MGRGESLLDPAVTEQVLERIRRMASGTYRDAEGKTNKEMAAAIFLSDKTVKNYRARSSPSSTCSAARRLPRSWRATACPGPSNPAPTRATPVSHSHAGDRR